MRSNLLKYILKRIVTALFVMLLVSVIVFVAIRLAPGDPVLNQIGPYGERTPEREAAIRAQLGLDKPEIVQYFFWIGNMLKGDFGVSVKSGKPALDYIMERVPASLELVGVAIVLALIISIPLGVLAGVKKGSAFDQGVSFVSSSLLAIPSFCIGLVMIYLFSVHLRILPASGYVSFAENPLLNLKLLIMPVTALGLMELADFTRFIRSDTIEVMNSNYIRTAKAKGLASNKVYFKHAFKNILVTLVTVVGLEFGTLLGGTVIVEQLFGWSGVGWLIYQSVVNRDYNVVQCAVLLIAAAFVVINTVVDILYAAIDPRIRLE